MRNKIFLISLMVIALFTQKSIAQEPIYRNLYPVNMYLENPAYTGANGGLNAYLNYHKQWTDFGNSPSILSAGAHSPIANNMNLGINIVNDKRTSFNHLYAKATYAYNLKLADDKTLNFGIGLGVLNNKFDKSDLIIQDASDPTLTDSKYEGAYLDASAGISYLSPTWEASISLPQAVKENQKNVGNLSAGIAYNIKANDDIDVKPSVFLHSYPKTDNLYDINVLTSWKKQAWLLVSYRVNNSFIAGVGCNWKMLNIGYSYQYNTGKLSNFVKSTHEIQLGILLQKNSSKPMLN